MQKSLANLRFNDYNYKHIIHIWKQTNIGNTIYPQQETIIVVLHFAVNKTWMSGSMYAHTVLEAR